MKNIKNQSGEMDAGVYSDARNFVIRSVIGQGERVQVVESAVAMLSRAGRADSPYGMGLIDGLEDVRRILTGDGVAYLAYVSVEKKLHAFAGLGFHPALVDVLAYFDEAGVALRGLWLLEEQGAVIVAEPLTEHAVWCEFRGDRDDQEVVDVLDAFSCGKKLSDVHLLDGFCYLASVKPEYRLRVASMLGTYPTLARILDLPMDYLDPLGMGGTTLFPGLVHLHPGGAVGFSDVLIAASSGLGGLPKPGTLRSSLQGSQAMDELGVLSPFTVVGGWRRKPSVSKDWSVEGGTMPVLKLHDRSKSYSLVGVKLCSDAKGGIGEHNLENFLDFARRFESMEGYKPPLRTEKVAGVLYKVIIGDGRP